MSSEISKGLKEAYKSIYLQKNIDVDVDVVDEHNIEEGIAKDIVKGALKYGSEAITKSAQKYGPKVVKAGKGAIKDVAKIPLKGAETAFKAVVKPLQTPLGSLAATAAGAEALLAGEKSKVRQGASWVSQQAQKGIQTAYGDNSSQQKPATASQPSRPKPEKPKPQTTSKLYEVTSKPPLTVSAGRTGTGVGKGFKPRNWTQAEVQRYKQTRGAEQIKTDIQLNKDVAAMNRQIAATPKGKDPEFYRPPTPTQRPPAPRPPSSGAGASRPPAQRPPVASAPTRQAPAQTGNKAVDMATWAKANPQLAAKVTPAGTQRGTGQSTMAKQAAELRGMQKASQERQAAQSGPMYSSPDVKSKMSSRTKAVLGLKDSYDIVLDYLLSQGHVDTLEEALYVMMEMDSKCIQSIVEGVMPEPINPAAHKAAQKTQKIYNLGKGTNNPNEAQSALKRTGPQLPGV
jgi:hypothetical protein